jgi:hypothetical protein
VLAHLNKSSRVDLSIYSDTCIILIPSELVFAMVHMAINNNHPFTNSLVVQETDKLNVLSSTSGIRLGSIHSVPFYSTNKTDRHDITEILLKVALTTITLTLTLNTFLTHEVGVL